MKFFTHEMKTTLKAGGGATVVLTLGGAVFGLIIGTLVSDGQAERYVRDHNCSFFWHLWEHFPASKAAQVCGAICTPVCEAADEMVSTTMNGFIGGFAGVLGGAALFTTLYFAYREYKNAQQEAEPLTDPSVPTVSYS